MDYRIEYDARHRIVLLSFQNDLTESTALAGFLAVAEFAKQNPIEGAITDVSHVRESHLSSAFLRRFVDTNTPVAPGKPRAVVAPKPAIFGLARVLEVYREPQSVGPSNVVRSMSEALAFLGLESTEFQPVRPIS